jgi:hypothetical protein
MQLGGPTWNVPLGRKDSRTASQSAANTNLQLNCKVCLSFIEKVQIHIAMERAIVENVQAHE